MNPIIKSLLKLLSLIYATAGLGVSLLANLMSYAGLAFPDAVFFALFLGMFPVFALVRFSPDLKPGMVVEKLDEWGGLKHSVYGCPAWMTFAVHALRAYGFFGFTIAWVILYIVAPNGIRSDHVPLLGWHMMSAFAITLYSMGFAVAWSTCFAHRCVNGHVVPWDAEVCSACGAFLGAMPT